MSEVNSLGSGLLVIAVLVLLLLFIVRGGKFGLSSAGGRSGIRGTGRAWNRSRTANRTPLEVFFALFALANLITSDSVGELGASVIVAALVLLVISYAVFSDLGLLVVIFGAVAAFADVATAKGMGVAVAVLVVTAFLAWVYYGVGGNATG